jgi:hypothetical protein
MLGLATRIVVRPSVVQSLGSFENGEAEKKTCSGDFGFMIFGLILTSEAIVMCTRLVRLSVKIGLV